MKNKILICIAVYLISLCTCMIAQESDTLLKGKYERETLMLEGNKNKYTKNKEWKRIGIFKPKLEGEFISSSPESKDEIKKFRKQRRRGAILLIAGGTVFISAAAVAPFIALPVFAASFGSGIGAYYFGAFDLHKSRKHLQKAVWLHNRDVLVKR